MIEQYFFWFKNNSKWMKIKILYFRYFQMETLVFKDSKKRYNKDMI